MKEELTTILDAMRAAQAELADYLVSTDRNGELTIAKLVGILDRREVVRAMRLLRVSKDPLPSWNEGSNKEFDHSDIANLVQSLRNSVK